MNILQNEKDIQELRNLRNFKETPDNNNCSCLQQFANSYTYNFIPIATFIIKNQEVHFLHVFF